MARADAGIAIGAGTDVAIDSAGVVLVSDDPRGVIGYNVISVPLAAGVLAAVGFVLAPAVGASLMNSSTIEVALNAQLLRRLNLRPAAPADPLSTRPSESRSRAQGLQRRAWCR